MCKGTRPNPSLGSLGAGWDTTGVRGLDRGFGERSWLVDGPSPSTVLVPAQSKSRRLAAKACWAAWVRMADQRERREASTAWRRMSGAALALVWASKRRKVVVSWLHRSPISRAKTTSRHLLERRSSGHVRSLDCSRVLSGSSAGLAGGG